MDANTATGETPDGVESDNSKNAKVIETTVSIKKLKEENILIDKGYGCGYSNQEVINAGLIYSFSKSRNADDSEIISQFENELDMSLQITFNEIVDEEFIACCKNQAEYY